MFAGCFEEVVIWLSGVVGGSGLAAGLVAVGAVAVVFILGLFLTGERYRRPPWLVSPVEFERFKREAEAGISDLAPRAMLLAEKERALGHVWDERSRRASGEFWRRFAVASASIEEDPLAALEELRALPALAERAISDLERAAQNEPP